MKLDPTDVFAPGPPAPPAPPLQRGAPRLRRLRVLFALMVREMGTRFGRSAGGYLWAVAEPLGGIVLLAVAFSLALRTPPLGTSFMLFYATGIVPFSMFNTVSKAVSGAVSSNRGLLTYPVVSVLDAVAAKFLLNFLTTCFVGLVLFAGILAASDVHVNLELAPVALSFVLAGLLGLGVGTLNCVLFGFFPTWKNVWAVVTRPLFIVSGVLFLYEAVPESFQWLMWWNPLVHVIAVMRTGFYGAYDPQFVSLSFVLLAALVPFVVGGYLLRRHASFLIEQ